MKELLQTPAPAQTVEPAPGPTPLLQRACACGGTPGPDGECAACKAKRLGVQRRAGGPGPGVAPPIVHGVLASAGRPLEPGVRGQMEARFGHDFSRVRVHTDGVAAESARSVAAHAYTVGSNVVFGSSRYAPGTAAGADLLAHELTHVVQQRDASPVPSALPVMPADDPLERAATASPAAGGARVQRQDVGDERFRRQDVLGPTPTRTGQVWTGSVDRQEIQEMYRRHPAVPPEQMELADFEGHGRHQVTIPGQPAREGWEPTVTRSMGEMTLEYDEGACELRIPTRLVFHNPGRGQLPTPDPCQTNSSAPSSPLAAGVFTALRGAFTDTVNERLNSWYRLGFEGCAAGTPCSGGATIRVVARDVTAGGGGAGPQVDVWLINASGRSCAVPWAPEAAFIYAPGGSRDEAMWGHEGAHFALHFGDEYNEAPNPTGRVQEADYSGLASRNMSSLALLHQRHFSFAPLFVNQVMQTAGRSCRASLREIERPTVPVFSETISFGGYGGASGGGEYVDLGFHYGVPLTRLRDWQAIVGAHARILIGLDGTRQDAMLAGIRLGLEHDFALSRYGYMLDTGLYGEGGAGLFDLGPGGRNEVHPYGEVGGYASLRFQQTGSVMPFIGVEAAAGGRLDVPGRIGTFPEPPRDAGPTEWVRFGLWVGIRH